MRDMKFANTIFAALFVSAMMGCQVPPEPDQVGSMVLQDSTLRSQVMHQIANQPKHRAEMMQYMVQAKSARADSLQMQMENNPEMREMMRKHHAMMHGHQMSDAEQMPDSMMQHMARMHSLCQEAYEGAGKGMMMNHGQHHSGHMGE